MRNKYAADMDKYFELLDVENDNKPEKSKRKFKNKRAQREFEARAAEL